MKPIGFAPDEVLRAFQEATTDERVKVLVKREDASAYIGVLREKANELRMLGAMEGGRPMGAPNPSITMKRLRLIGWMEQQRASGLEKRLGKFLR